MPIATTCPHCRAAYNLPNNLRGKKMRCKKCEQTFPIGGDDEVLDVEIVDVEAAREDRVQERSRPVRMAAVARRRDEDEEDDAPARRRRARRDRDDDDAPRSSMMPVYLIAGGAVLLLVLVGGGVGLYFLLRSDEPVAQTTTPTPPPVVQPVLPVNPPVQLGPPPVQNNPPPVQLNPPPVQQPVRPTRANRNLGSLDEAVQALRSPDGFERMAAANFLAQAPVDPGRRNDVADQLVPLLIDNNGLAADAAAKALAVWATRSQVPGLLRGIDSGHPGVRQSVIETLGKLKDERAAGPLAEKLTNFFDRAAASKALADLGSVAEKEVVKYAFHKDNGTHEEARKLLKAYGTKDSLVIGQAAVDLKSVEDQRRINAANWLATVAVDPSQQADIAKGLEAVVDSNLHWVREAGFKALKVWATKDNVTMLIRLTDSNDGGTRDNAMQVLGKLKDEKGLLAVVARLANFFDRGKAKAVLITVGVEAEDPIIKSRVLFNPDSGARKEAAEVLAAIGTKKSISPLQDLFAFETRRNDKALAQTAGNAILIIRTREKDKP